MTVYNISLNPLKYKIYKKPLKINFLCILIYKNVIQIY